MDQLPYPCVRRMHKGLFIILFLFGVISLHGQNYQLVFADEFNGTAVDPNNWTFLFGDGTDVGLPPGWGNNELQYYREENTTVSGGFMTITAREEFFEGYNYTSSRLITEGKHDFTYGRFEMRAKMPIGQGLWPAYWMFFTAPGAYGGWAASGEIDIMEYLGDKPNEVFGTIHFGEPFPGNLFSSIEYTLPSGDFNEDFHLFAIEWEPGEIRWFVDEVLYATQNIWWSNGGPYPAPFDQDFHLLLNLAVGGNLPGNPDETTVFPQEYVIDYVRVYEDLDLPTVTLDAPANGASIAAGDNLTLTATPSAPLGVTKVEFFQGDLKLGEATSAPYELTINNVSEGSYRLRAIVTDNNGKFNYSDFAEITVGAGGQGPYALNPLVLPGILEMENYDVGGNGVAFNDNDSPLNQGSKNSSNTYRSNEGVDLEPTTDVGGGQNVGFINAGEWIEYTVDVAATAEYDIISRVASSSSGGSFRVLLDGADITGPLSFGNTGGSQSWIDVGKEGVTLSAGVQVLRVEMLQGGFNFNRITVSPADPFSGEKVTFDDMEHGDPLGNGWFTFNGDGGGGISANSTDLPPRNAGSFSLETGWGSGGVPGFFGGFGRGQVVQVGATDFFNFWINPNAGQDYTLEINIQDDEDDDGNPSDEFQYNLVVNAGGGDVIAGGGWQLVSIPLSDFFDDNSFVTAPEGNGTLDSKVINIVWAVISNSGADVNFRTDFWSFTNGPLGPEINVSPDANDFGSIGLGGNGAQLFTLNNEGCTALDITATSIIGANAADFQIVSGNAPVTVAPGSSETLLVTFTPDELGARSAELVIESSDVDEPVTTIPLTGTGIDAPVIQKVLFDDMEHGDPQSNDYFTFNGLSGVTLEGTSTDLPPENSGAFSLSTSMTSGGTSGFFGGFGRTFPVDLTDMTHFNFWINPDAEQDYLIEIQLQDDDNGDDLIPFPSQGNDDEFQFNFNVNASGDAIAGGGWQLISIPLNAFFDDNSLQNGGNGILDPIAVSSGGNGQLVNVVFGFISNSGSDISLRTDFWCFSKGPLNSSEPDIEVTPLSQNFGLISPGTTNDETFTIANNGGAPLEVSALNITGPDAASFAAITSAPLTVDIGETADVVVAFSPDNVGPKSATLEIVSNDPDAGVVSVALAGEGSNINKVIFDDMEHGNPLGNGWFTFNGIGGGGLDVSTTDLPPVSGGVFSLQTGWGAGGNTGFFGGFGRTQSADLSQMTHFNIWINPDAGQAYTLEINLQEDDDGDGSFPFPAPNDDEFQYNLTVGESGTDVIAGGGWQLVSIPFTDFFDDNSIHGGNGVFDPTPVADGGNGELLGIVIAVIGDSGSDVNFRTDFWCFSEGPVRAKLPFDDMEHGDPFNNGWFAFGGAVGGGGLDANFSDLPPQNGGIASLQSGWGSGGTPGFFGGFGRTSSAHIANLTHFNFWINPDADQDYLLEINLQEDDDGDGVFPFPAPNDDEFQFNLEVGPNGKHAIAGGGWQLISIPFTDFFDDNSIHGGNGIFDPVPTGSGGNGQLLSIVVAVISNSGADVNFRTDFWCFSDGPLEEADIALNPAAFDFGGIEVGSSSSQDFEVSNAGIANLWVDAISISGSDAGEFSATGVSAPVAVPGGQNATISVSFAPSSASATTKSATLEVVSNDPDEPSVSSQLTGLGIPGFAHPYLLLADDDIEVERPTTFVGDVHTNDDLELERGDPSTYVGNLTAVDDIEIEKDNTVQGNVTAGDDVDLDKDVTITGDVIENANVEEVSLPDLDFEAGGDDVDVKKFGSSSLAPGSYGEVEVERGGNLTLSSGSYFLEELELKKDATLTLDISNGPIVINVEDDVELNRGANTVFNPDINDESLFLTLNTLDDVELKRDATFKGSILAPHGEVELSRGVSFEGAICAEEIEVSRDGALLFHGATAPEVGAKSVPETTEEETTSAPEIAQVPRDYSFYPNPAGDYLNVFIPSEATESMSLRLYDYGGRLRLLQTVAPNSLQQVDLRSLPNGIYLLKVDGLERFTTQKVIIQH